MIAYQQVEEYMKEVGLKYIKTANDFIAGLAYRTDKQYAQDMAQELNARAEGAPVDNAHFYELKNRSLDGSIYVSAAFDGGVFRHIGNLVIDNAALLGSSVLDLCCDCGIVTCFMAQQNPNVQFTGVDINEGAIQNAKELAQRLGVTNAEFICADVFDLPLDGEYDCITSFRALLDACDTQTQGLNFVGLREEREASYQNAFQSFADVVAKHLKETGHFISVERYTAEYGWLGWMMALSAAGLGMNTAQCGTMQAMDISSTKEYSVTFAGKQFDGAPLDTFNEVLSRGFKSGMGYDGGMAEFALYYDSEGEIEFTDVIKGRRVIHQYAFATSKSGKGMYYDAANNNRKIKYFNLKKADKMRADFEAKIKLYDPEQFTLRHYTKAN